VRQVIISTGCCCRAPAVKRHRRTRGCDSSPRPMPDVLTAALVAFLAEHQRCGELGGGKDDAWVWLACSCGAC